MYPQLGRYIHLKVLINSRFGLWLWQAIVIVCWKAHYELYISSYNKGFVFYPITTITILQTIYLAKFYYWEDGYMQVCLSSSIDQVDPFRLISDLSSFIDYRYCSRSFWFYDSLGLYRFCARIFLFRKFIFGEEFANDCAQFLDQSSHFDFWIIRHLRKLLGRLSETNRSRNGWSMYDLVPKANNNSCKIHRFRRKRKELTSSGIWILGSSQTFELFFRNFDQYIVWIAGTEHKFTAILLYNIHHCPSNTSDHSRR